MNGRVGAVVGGGEKLSAKFIVGIGCASPRLLFRHLKLSALLLFAGVYCAENTRGFRVYRGSQYLRLFVPAFIVGNKRKFERSRWRSVFYI